MKPVRTLRSLSEIAEQERRMREKNAAKARSDGTSQGGSYPQQKEGATKGTCGEKKMMENNDEVPLNKKKKSV